MFFFLWFSTWDEVLHKVNGQYPAAKRSRQSSARTFPIHSSAINYVLKHLPALTIAVPFSLIVCDTGIYSSDRTLWHWYSAKTEQDKSPPFPTISWYFCLGRVNQTAEVNRCLQCGDKDWMKLRLELCIYQQSLQNACASPRVCWNRCQPLSLSLELKQY